MTDCAPPVPHTSMHSGREHLLGKLSLDWAGLDLDSSEEVLSGWHNFQLKLPRHGDPNSRFFLSVYITCMNQETLEAGSKFPHLLAWSI